MTLSLATFGIGILVTAAVTVVSAMVARHREVRSWFCSSRARREAPDTAQIFSQFIARITTCTDRRTLCATLLQYMAELTHAENGSLLMRNGTPDRFVVRETYQIKLGSFQVGEIRPFIDWLRQRAVSVSRRTLLTDPALAETKAVGLQYCVQFHAEVSIPCFLGGELLAIINLGPRRNNVPYDPALCQLLDLLSGLCALSIHNASLYDDLAQKHQELQHLGELKGHLLANVSHEIRTPLTSVIGLSEHLLEHGDSLGNDERVQYVRMIHGSGKRLLDTVTALMELAKLETDRTNLDIRRINLARLSSEVCSALPPTPATTVQSELSDMTPPIYGDPVWIKCLFEHVLGNAIKYTPQGRVWVEAKRAGDMLTVGIHDTGIGIAKEKQKAVFSEFIQASQGSARTHEGAGVGLAIARKVVELHGGRIWMQSHPGSGSHLFFTLPLKPAG